MCRVGWRGMCVQSPLSAFRPVFQTCRQAQGAAGLQPVVARAAAAAGHRAVRRAQVRWGSGLLLHSWWQLPVCVLHRLLQLWRAPNNPALIRGIAHGACCAADLPPLGHRKTRWRRCHRCAAGAVAASLQTDCKFCCVQAAADPMCYVASLFVRCRRCLRLRATCAAHRRGSSCSPLGPPSPTRLACCRQGAGRRPGVVPRGRRGWRPPCWIGLCRQHATAQWAWRHTLAYANERPQLLPDPHPPIKHHTAGGCLYRL